MVPSMKHASALFLLALGCTESSERTPVRSPGSLFASPPAAAPDAAPQPASAPTSQPVVGPARGEGHQRMVRLLAEVAKQPNDYFGEAQFAELEPRLARATDPFEKVTLLYQLSWNEMRVGRPRKAAARIETARALASKLPPKKKDAQIQLDYALAVAWLRVAEDENCAQVHTGESCIMPLRGGAIHRRREGSTKAIEALIRVIEHPRVSHERRVAAGWLLNIASMTLAEYPRKVPKSYLIEPAVFSSPPFPHFRNIAASLGLDRVSLSGGGIVDDFDGDDDLDILTSSWDPAKRMAFFANNGDGSFTERGVEAGLAGITGGLNMIHADYDNDGDADLYVLRGAWLGHAGLHPNSLLQNDGAGRFTDVTFAAGLGENHYPTQTASWGDFDLDGDLDLYVGNEAQSPKGWPNQLFRNNGDGTFTDVTIQAGVEDRRFTKGVVWGDFDRDRWPDLYVSNAGAANRLYRNNRDGTFTDLAVQKGVTEPMIGFPTWWWDFDNDGWLDLVAFNGYGPPKTDAPTVWHIAASYIGIPHPGERTRLYRNNGAGGFRDVTKDREFRAHTLAMGSNFGDLDNDGWLDVYLGTGYPDYEGLMPNVALRNVEGRFTDVSFTSGLAHLQKGHGVAFADLDRDGDQDVFEQMGGAFPGDAFGNAFYENPGNRNHWIVVHAVGVESNRSAIGARIKAVVRNRKGERREIFRHVDSGGSFGGNPLRQHIGLGPAKRVERLEVFWPKTKKRQVFKDLAVDQAIRVTEGASTAEQLDYVRTPFRKH